MWSYFTSTVSISLGSGYGTNHGSSCFITYSTIPYCLAWCSSNKAVSLSFDWHRSGSPMGRFQVCRANGVSVRLSPWRLWFW